MAKCLIIDGYNVICRIKELSKKRNESLEASRMYLIRTLQNFLSKKHIFDRVIVVFDSKEDTLGVRKINYGKVEAIFSTKDKDADQVIVDILKNSSSSQDITVSSDDNFIINHVRVYGKKTMSVKELENIILLKKKSFRGTIKQNKINVDKVIEINKELKKHWGL